MMLLRDIIYQKLRDAILACEFVPGQQLREETLAIQYDVSRTPVRESLLRLTRDGLLTLKPRNGYFVKSVTASDVTEILNLRYLVEPVCAAAAARASEAATRELDHFRGFADQDFTQSNYFEYDEAFHGSVINLSDNRRIVALALDLIGQYERARRILTPPFDLEAVRVDCREHEAIIDALEIHDSDGAFRLACKHIEGMRAQMVQHMTRQSSKVGVNKNDLA